MTGISDDQTARATAITATRVRWARQVWRRSGPLITPAAPSVRPGSRAALVVVDRVQLEERVLEAGGLDQQVGHRQRGDRREQRLRVALEVAGQSRAVDRDRRDAGHARRGPAGRPRTAARRGACGGRGASRRPRSRPAGPARTTATRSQTRSTSDSTCDENSTVRPARRTSSRIDVERPLHQRVEALGGLVEDRQLGVVLQRLDDARASGACRASSRGSAGGASARRARAGRTARRGGRTAGRRDRRGRRGGARRSARRGTRCRRAGTRSGRGWPRTRATMSRPSTRAPPAVGCRKPEQQPDERALAGAVRARGTRTPRPRRTSSVTSSSAAIAAPRRPRPPPP